MMYRYILFDLDGTLVDSKEGIFNCIRYALETMGEPVPAEETLNCFIGPPLYQSYMDHCGFDRETANHAVRLFRERYARQGRFEVVAAPGMVDVCRRLQEKGYILCLASSKPEAMCRPICEMLGYTPSLREIVGSPPSEDMKKEIIVREALDRLGIREEEKAEVLMVGDRRYDVEGAAANGLSCVGVSFFDYAPPGELAEAGAVAVVRTAEELEAFIMSH